MCLPTSPGRVLPHPLFFSMASKLLRDQQSLVSLLIAPMLSDVFEANVEGRVCLPLSFGQVCNMCLPTSPGRVLPLPPFLSVASKLLRDQESLLSLLMAPMWSDVFGANVEGHVLGPCCETCSQICISPYICILCTMDVCLPGRASDSFFHVSSGPHGWGIIL